MASNTDYEELQVHCPFCLKSDLIMMDDDDVHYALCMECRCCGPTAETPELAIAAWCDRPDPSDPGFISRASRTILMG